jgi:hypothetical protein
MKRPQLLAVLSVPLLIVAAYVTYLHWATATFVSREIKRRTGAKQVQVLDEFHRDGQWYGEVEIDQETGKRLLARDDWKSDFEKSVTLAGRISSDRPSDCSKCYYRIEQDPHDAQYHPYNYRLYVLRPDGKVLEVYEVFGS